MYVLLFMVLYVESPTPSIQRNISEQYNDESTNLNKQINIFPVLICTIRSLRVLCGFQNKRNVLTETGSIDFLSAPHFTIIGIGQSDDCSEYMHNV